MADLHALSAARYDSRHCHGSTCGGTSVRGPSPTLAPLLGELTIHVLSSRSSVTIFLGHSFIDFQFMIGRWNLLHSQHPELMCLHAKDTVFTGGKGVNSSSLLRNDANVAVNRARGLCFPRCPDLCNPGRPRLFDLRNLGRPLLFLPLDALLALPLQLLFGRHLL